MAHVTKSECCGRSRLCKIALTVTLACLFAVVTAARGDEPAAAPAESKPAQAETAKAAAIMIFEASSVSDVEPWSDATRKFIEELRKNGLVRVVEGHEALFPPRSGVVLSLHIEGEIDGDQITSLFNAIRGLGIAPLRVVVSDAGSGTSTLGIDVADDISVATQLQIRDALVKVSESWLAIGLVHRDKTSVGGTLATNVAKPESPAAPAPDAAPATSQPEPFDPAIIIETTPAIERSEAIRTVVEALEKERIAIRSDEDRAGKPIDFYALINVQPDLSAQKIRELLDTLRKQSIGRISFSEGPAAGLNRVVVNCPADVTWRRVRTLQEEIEKHEDFTFDIRVAANNNPMTPPFPPTPRFTDNAEPPIGPATVPGIDGDLGSDFGFGGIGGAGGVAMGLPSSAIPGRNWVAGTKVIVTFSDDGKQVMAYSEQHPRWIAQELEQVADTKPVPVVGGGDTVAVRVGHLFYAYSATLGKWDVLKLPPGEVAVPVVGDDGVNIHSASQGDFVFRNSWGKWFSTDEIKAGRVAEHLLTQHNAARADRAVDKTTGEVTVFYLKFVEAKEAARIVRQLFGGVVNPAVEERTNSLLVASDDPLAVRKVEELLKAIDSPAAKDVDLDFRSSVGGADEKADELRGKLAELEQRTQELAARLRGPLPDPATGDRLNKELRDAVKQAFEARQKLQRAELADFAERLRRIQQSIEMRDRVSQQIIDRRVEELLHPNLEWDAPAVVSENQVPPVRDVEHVTNNNLPKSTPPADQSSSRYPGGKPLKAFVRIAFDKSQLGKVDWLAGPGSLTVDGFGKGLIVTPIGSTTSLRLTDLPGRDNAAMFVTLQTVSPPSSKLLQKGVLNSVQLLANNPIPLQITDKDCDRVLSGELVTKWVYLPHDLSTAGESIFNTVDSSRSEANSIPIAEVEKRGVVVAILRLSNRPEPREVVPPTSRPHDVSPRSSVRTLPDEFRVLGPVRGEVSESDRGISSRSIPRLGIANCGTAPQRPRGKCRVARRRYRRHHRHSVSWRNKSCEVCVASMAGLWGRGTCPSGHFRARQ